MRAAVLSLVVACAYAAKPNIIFILTDDQDLVLDSEKATPTINSLIRDAGATVETGIVSTPICCPSRTISVSGRYSHNNGYGPNNPPGCMHVEAEDGVFANTSTFYLMQQAGYVTAAVGKVTNDQDGYFCKSHRRDSMDFVYAPCSFNDYWTTKYFVANATNAGVVDIANDPTAYQTSQLGNYTMNFIKQHAAAQREAVASGAAPQPFFAWVGPHAPHYPADVAPWYAEELNGTIAPRVPSYNYSAPDHHGFISTNPMLDDVEASFIDQHYRDRLRALMSVDDMAAGILDTLKAEGLADNTYILYSSDHGYKMGNLNVPCSKQQPYDTDLRVPLSWAGPGIKAGTKLNTPSSNVDFLPTWLDLAGIPIPSIVDGKSLAPLLVTEPNSVYQPRSQTEQAAVRASWRTEIIAEYLSVGTYYSDHCSMWFPKPGDYQGQDEKAPKANASGALWYVDDTASNSFRTLRIWNGTHNMIYSEFDHTYAFTNMSTIEFYEAYDLDQDPWALNNIYSTFTDDQKLALHTNIATYYSCSGSTCP